MGVNFSERPQKTFVNDGKTNQMPGNCQSDMLVDCCLHHSLLIDPQQVQGSGNHVNPGLGKLADRRTMYLQLCLYRVGVTWCGMELSIKSLCWNGVLPIPETFIFRVSDLGWQTPERQYLHDDPIDFLLFFYPHLRKS